MIKTVTHEKSQVVLSVNGIRARNLRGLIWMWFNLRRLVNLVARSEGCIQHKVAMCSLFEVVQISYWTNRSALMAMFPDPDHLKMIEHVKRHPDQLTLYNEIYSAPPQSKYVNEPHGLARTVTVRATD